MFSLRINYGLIVEEKIVKLLNAAWNAYLNYFHLLILNGLRVEKVGLDFALLNFVINLCSNLADSIVLSLQHMLFVLCKILLLSKELACYLLSFPERQDEFKGVVIFKASENKLIIFGLLALYCNYDARCALVLALDLIDLLNVDYALLDYSKHIRNEH